MFYKALFNINIHHDYFLDIGNKKFRSIDDDDIKEIEKALSKYTITEYLQIIPTGNTLRLFKNHRMLLRPHSQGVRLLISTLEETVEGGDDDLKKYRPLIQLDDDMMLTFELRTTDIYFNNYTRLTNSTNNKLYLFSNVIPDEQVDFENIFENNGGTINNKFLLNEEASRDLLRAIATEEDDLQTSSIGQFSISNILKLIEEDDTLNNNQKTKEVKKILNDLIQEKKKQGVIGYIRFSIKGDDDHHILEFDDDDLENTIQYTPEVPPEFTLSFINKRTFWRYNKLSDDVTLTTINKNGSTKNGFIEISLDDLNFDVPEDINIESIEKYVFPNPTVTSVKKEGNDYYSEIFI